MFFFIPVIALSSSFVLDRRTKSAAEGLGAGEVTKTRKSPTMDSVEATRRLHTKKQTLDDAYAAPANFLEIDVINPITHGIAKKRYTDYEVRMRVKSCHFLVMYTSKDLLYLADLLE